MALSDLVMKYLNMHNLCSWYNLKSEGNETNFIKMIGVWPWPDAKNYHWD